MSKTKDILVETSYKGTGVYFRTTTDIFTATELLSSRDSESFVLNDVENNPIVVDKTEQKNILENYDSDDDATNSENLGSSANSSLSLENFNDKDNTENVAEVTHYRNVRRTFSISSTTENLISKKGTSRTQPTKIFGTLTRNGSVSSDILMTDRDHGACEKVSAKGCRGGLDREELVSGETTPKKGEGADVELNGEMHQEKNSYHGSSRSEGGVKMIEKVIGHRWKANGQLQYLIMLENIRYPLWKHECYLINADELIQNYWVRVGRSQLESINHPLVRLLKVPNDAQRGLLLSRAQFSGKMHNIESCPNDSDLTPKPRGCKDPYLDRGNQESCHVDCGTREDSMLLEDFHESNIDLDFNVRVEADDSIILKALRETNISTDTVEQDAGDREVEMSLGVRRNENENISGAAQCLSDVGQENSVVDKNSQRNVTPKGVTIEGSRQNVSDVKDMIQNEEVVASGGAPTSQPEENISHKNRGDTKNTETSIDNVNDVDSLQADLHVDNVQERVACENLNDSNILQLEDSHHNDIIVMNVDDGHDKLDIHKESQMHISNNINVNVDHTETSESKTPQKNESSYADFHQMDVDDPRFEERTPQLDESMNVNFHQNESNVVKHSQRIHQETIKCVSIQIKELKESTYSLNSDSEDVIIESHHQNLLHEVTSRKENRNNIEDGMVVDTDNADTNMTSTGQKTCSELENEFLTTGNHNKEAGEKNIGTNDTRKRKCEQIEFDFRMFKLNQILPEDDECRGSSEDVDMFVDNVEVDTNWDPYVECIETVQRDPNTKKLYMVIRWKNGIKTVHWADDANQKCPQKILDFYESKIRIVIRRR